MADVIDQVRGSSRRMFAVDRHDTSGGECFGHRHATLPCVTAAGSACYE